MRFSAWNIEKLWGAGDDTFLPMMTQCIIMLNFVPANLISCLSLRWWAPSLCSVPPSLGPTLSFSYRWRWSFGCSEPSMWSPTSQHGLGALSRKEHSRCMCRYSTMCLYVCVQRVLFYSMQIGAATCKYTYLTFVCMFVWFQSAWQEQVPVQLQQKRTKVSG